MRYVRVFLLFCYDNSKLTDVLVVVVAAPYQAGRSERSHLLQHSLDYSHDTTNRYMEYESWIKFLRDVGIIAPARQGPTREQQIAAAAAAAAAKRAAKLKAAQESALNPLARSRTFQNTMSSRNLDTLIASLNRMEPGQDQQRFEQAPLNGAANAKTPETAKPVSDHVKVFLVSMTAKETDTVHEYFGE